STQQQDTPGPAPIRHRHHPRRRRSHHPQQRSVLLPRHGTPHGPLLRRRHPHWPAQRTMNPLTTGLRVVLAGLLAGIALVPLDLWNSHGYRHIPTIGPLFLLNVITGLVLAIATLASPQRLLCYVAGADTLYAIATLAALAISINFGLFGFTDSTDAP